MSLLCPVSNTLARANVTGLLPVVGDGDAWRKGVVTFSSFIGFGSVPVLTYAALRGAVWGESGDMTFLIACLATSLTLFLLGVAKARITKQNSWESGALMLLNGGLAAAAAYLVGYAMGEALNI